ncbi:MAG TPA: hypothetical protein ENJ95_02160 [Bacteroidetes bacterium]|nr:hypothetical protein [Bacteroidota bacterium]
MKNSTVHSLIKCSAILILLALPFIISAQKNNDFYFDENGNSIKKSKFEKKVYKDGYLDIKEIRNDSVMHRLVFREEEGTINKNDLGQLRDYLKKCTGETFSSNEIIVIIYYPGKDPCNSSGVANTDRFLIKKYHQNLKQGLEEQGNVHLVNLYKSYEGLKPQKGIVKWYPDVDGEIEQRFFKQHYPCRSYVVINTTGAYYAYFGEYPDSTIIDVVKIFNEKNKEK